MSVDNRKAFQSDNGQSVFNRQAVKNNRFPTGLG